MHEETASLLASVVFISKLFLLEKRLNRSSTNKLIGRTKILLDAYSHGLDLDLND